MLTKEEKILLCQIAADNESGNHLLRPRSEEYWELKREVAEAMSCKNQDNRQKEIVEYLNQITI